MSIEWTNIHRRFKGLWVSLADDEKTVLASGKTAREAWSKAQKKGYERPILSRIPDHSGAYVGLL